MHVPPLEIGDIRKVEIFQIHVVRSGCFDFVCGIEFNAEIPVQKFIDGIHFPVFARRVHDDRIVFSEDFVSVCTKFGFIQSHPALFIERRISDGQVFPLKIDRYRNVVRCLWFFSDTIAEKERQLRSGKLFGFGRIRRQNNLVFAASVLHKIGRSVAYGIRISACTRR